MCIKNKIKFTEIFKLAICLPDKWSFLKTEITLAKMVMIFLRYFFGHFFDDLFTNYFDKIFDGLFWQIFWWFFYKIFLWFWPWTSCIPSLCLEPISKPGFHANSGIRILSTKGIKWTGQMMMKWERYRLEPN
jgi:hypothetical protein